MEKKNFFYLIIIIFLVFLVYVLAGVYGYIEYKRFKPYLFGSSVDLALIIPLVYFLFIRKTSIPKITVVPVFILSLTLAFQIIPSNYHNTLSIFEMMVAPLEMAIIWK